MIRLWRFVVVILVIVLSAFLFVSIAGGLKPKKPDVPVRVVEDDPRWQCWRMGNGVCSHG